MEEVKCSSSSSTSSLLYGAFDAEEEQFFLRDEPSFETMNLPKPPRLSKWGRFLGGSVCILAIAGVAVRYSLTQGFYRAMASGDDVFEESTDTLAAAPPTPGSVSGMLCTAHVRSAFGLAGVRLGNMSKVDVIMLQDVGKDFIGEVLSDLAGYSDLTGIWAAPETETQAGMVKLKFVFEMGYVVAAGEPANEAYEGEAISQRTMKFLVRAIQAGEAEKQWMESLDELGAARLLFPNETQTDLKRHFAAKESEILVDTDTEILWMDDCSPPTAAPVYKPTYAPTHRPTQNILTMKPTPDLTRKPTVHTDAPTIYPTSKPTEYYVGCAGEDTPCANDNEAIAAGTVASSSSSSAAAAASSSFEDE